MKNRLELHLAASDFARNNLDKTDSREVDAAVCAEADRLKLSGPDYDLFKQTFVQCRQNYLALRQQTLPGARVEPPKPAPAK